MHAIDLNTGNYKWSIPFGNTPELGEEGKGTGTENYGGAVVTENGLLFIAATRDGFFRVFEMSFSNPFYFFSFREFGKAVNLFTHH